MGALRWHTVAWITAQTTLVPAGTPAPSGLTVHWSQPLLKSARAAWRVSPPLAGRWVHVSSRVWTFRPSGLGWAPDTRATLTIPGGSRGPQTLAHAYLRHTLEVSWTTPPGRTLRLQQWLAELGYLPVIWTPASGSPPMLSWASAYQPPTGHFTWRYPAVPGPLRQLWQPGQWTVMVQGAMMHFEHHAGLAQTTDPTAAVWEALRTAVARHQAVTSGYSYAYVSETAPEQLWLWYDGTVLVHTLVNTGIPATPTFLGTYPVYEKRAAQVMRGVAPNGVPYADAVHWINYFWGSNAVHGFVRAAYGFPQSLGCVEVPLSVAAQIYDHLPVGGLVTVVPPGSPPL
ncbi:MAG: L,D-transpeptidase [Clostridia bacterium]